MITLSLGNRLLSFLTPSFIAIILSCLANAGEPLVSLDYHHSLRIPNRHVAVAIDSEGSLTLTTQSKDKDKTVSELVIPPDRLQELKRELEKINWRKVSSDKTIGLDGTSVKISSGDRSASLWSPDYDSKKRGLVGLQKLIESLFDLAGLDPTGMPK